MWSDRLVEVNRPGPSGLVIAHLHPGEVSTSFQQSLMNTMGLDAARFGRMTDSRGHLGLIATQAGAGTIDKARNDAVAVFLTQHPEADLLLFADSDMGWDPEAAEVLAETMEQLDLPILGGLCFGQKVTGMGPQHSAPTEWFPTLYRWSTEDGAFDTAYDYPPDAVVEVGATGAAFVMIHRRVLEAVAAADGPNWFTPTTVEDHPRPFGEDMSFCIRARRAGFGTFVHTGVKTSHRKETWITESDYRDVRLPASSAVSVVIPVKDNLEMTRQLVGQLHAQGGYTDLLIFDNGSTDPATVEWLAAQDAATVFDAVGSGISEMWNAGIAEALARHGGLADVVLLNNDIRVGPRFLRRLVAGLRSQPGMMAASANYDGRPGSGVSPLRGICANRYDGTGGLAGFAFAVRAEWIASGFRFDESMAWWYSDNDLCLEVEKAGGWYGLVHDARCEHLGGGSQTVTPSDWADIIAADRKAFEAKWPHVTLTAA